MGFFEGMRRIVMGEPVFQEEAQTQSTLSDNPSSEVKNKTGLKNLPIVEVVEVHHHTNANHATNYFFIQNNSSQMLWLDKITVLGMTRRIDDEIGAGERKEVLCYDGPTATNPHQDEVDLIYKDMTGDYFMARHDVRFRYEVNGTYEIEEVRFRGVVKDI